MDKEIFQTITDVITRTDNIASEIKQVYPNEKLGMLIDFNNGVLNLKFCICHDDDLKVVLKDEKYQATFKLNETNVYEVIVNMLNTPIMTNTIKNNIIFLNKPFGAMYEKIVNTPQDALTIQQRNKDLFMSGIEEEVKQKDSSGLKV